MTKDCWEKTCDQNSCEVFLGHQGYQNVGESSQVIVKMYTWTSNLKMFDNVSISYYLFDKHLFPQTQRCYWIKYPIASNPFVSVSGSDTSGNRRESLDNMKAMAKLKRLKLDPK